MHTNALGNLRNSIRQKRRTLSATDKMKSATQIVNQLIQHPILQNSYKIAAYLPSDGEVNLTYWFERAWRQSKQCYLPVIVNKKLLFALYTPTTKLQANRWNILEPVSNELIAPDQLEATIVPLVAFDKYGNRMGRGLGYYDRSFAFTNKLSTHTKRYLIGVAYAFQESTQLTPNRWDIPMHSVITELKTINCNLH